MNFLNSLRQRWQRLLAGVFAIGLVMFTLGQSAALADRAPRNGFEDAAREANELLKETGDRSESTLDRAKLRSNRLGNQVEAQTDRASNKVSRDIDRAGNRAENQLDRVKSRTHDAAQTAKRQLTEQDADQAAVGDVKERAGNRIEKAKEAFQTATERTLEEGTPVDVKEQ